MAQWHFNKTKQEKAGVWQELQYQQRLNNTLTHSSLLTLVTSNTHKMQPQVSRRASSVKVEHEKKPPTSKQKLVLQARVFFFNQEASISLMGALVRRAVTQQLQQGKLSNESSVESFDLCVSQCCWCTVCISVTIHLLEWVEFSLLTFIFSHLDGFFPNNRVTDWGRWMCQITH